MLLGYWGEECIGEIYAKVFSGLIKTWMLTEINNRSAAWRFATESVFGFHEIFSLEKITGLKIRHPYAKLIAHPECEEPILKIADFVGSTTQLLKYAIKDSGTEYIVATEAGILHQMQKEAPSKVFIPAPPNNACACNDRPYMKLNTFRETLFVHGI